MKDALLRREFARKIKAARERKGWTDMDLCRASGIPQPTLHDYQNPHEGKPPALPRGDRLARLAKALEVSADYLLSITDNPTGGRATPGHAFQEGGMRALADVLDALEQIRLRWRGADTVNRSGAAGQMIDEAEAETAAHPQRRKQPQRQKGA